MTPILAASDSGLDVHISLKAEEVFRIGDFVVTNSIIYGILVATTLFIFLTWVSKRSKIRPAGGIIAIIELFVEFIHGLLTSVFNSETRARKYAPIFGVFFAFVFFSNTTGLLPLVGSGIAVGETPIFRPFTADLNGTIAMSVFAIIMVQYLSIKEQGAKAHLQHYFTDKPWNPINLFVGILEIFGELTRVISLSLRLFLNTAVGEILIAVFLALGAFAGSFTTLPIALLEILVAGIQAYVFTILGATYLSLATAHADHEESHAHSAEHAAFSNHSADNPGLASASGAVNG